jgi:hypothetical protein
LYHAKVGATKMLEELDRAVLLVDLPQQGLTAGDKGGRLLTSLHSILQPG